MRQPARSVFVKNSDLPVRILRREIPRLRGVGLHGVGNMSKVIISTVATVLALFATAGTATWKTGGATDIALPAAVAHDGYYITEFRKADRLPIRR